MDNDDQLRLATIGVGLKADAALERVARVERIQSLLLTGILTFVVTLLALSLRRGGGWWRRDDDPDPEPGPTPREEVSTDGRA